MDSKTAIRQLKAIRRMGLKHNMRLAAEWNSKYKILISTILSAQTRDEVTIEVCKKLFRKYPSMTSLSEARLNSIRKIIRPINYYKTKSKNILATAKMLRGRRIPETTEELLNLPGVGRKVANVYLSEAHRADVIGVDTHVKRISFKLGWTKSKNQHRIEKDLMNLFPKKYWGIINDSLVRFGRGTKRNNEDKILGKLIK